jgi:hypothetical protein
VTQNSPTETDVPGGPCEPSPVMRLVALLFVAVPILGTGVHAAMFVWATREFVVTYYKGGGPIVVFVLGWVIYLASLKHQAHTGMRLNVAARALCFVWMASTLLIVPGLYVKLHELLA